MSEYIITYIYEQEEKQQLIQASNIFVALRLFEEDYLFGEIIKIEKKGR